MFKLLVKIPGGFVEALQTFPFLHYLKDQYKDLELNIICEENVSWIFNFLPFRVRTFERPADKRSMIKTHHFCANLNVVFNIDLFIDLENSLNSAFIGWHFCSKDRIGLKRKWNHYLLSHSFEMNSEPNLEQLGFDLIERYKSEKIEDYKVLRKIVETEVVDEKVEKLFKEPEPPKYILLMISNLESFLSKKDFWKDLIDQFEDQHFILWTYANEAEISDLFTSIDFKNRIYLQKGNDVGSLLQIFTKVKAIITTEVWCEVLCSYLGLECFAFYDQNTQRPFLQRYKLKSNIVTINQNAGRLIEVEGVRKEIDGLGSAIDIIHERINL